MNNIQLLFLVVLYGLGGLMSHVCAQVNFSNSNLPIVVIQTQGQEIPDEPKIDADMGIIYNGVGQRNYLSDPWLGYNGRIGIELRGSTSQDLSDKKPYALETRDAEGEDLNVSLLGMPAESDWVLLAPYSDKSLMRDVLIYNLAARIMPWAPRTRFCELVLNGQYQGVYALMEKIKRDPNRVDIAKLDEDENSGDDLTGGYILKIDKWTGLNNDGFTSFYTPTTNPLAEIVFQYDYPNPDDISPDQKEYIQQYIHSFEHLMASDTYADPVTGYPSVIDVSSFVDFFLINELARNVDGYRLSTFLYKDKDSNDPRLKMGPVWDFNIALGNADYCNGGWMTGWAADFNEVCSGDYWLIPFWWERLRQDPAFLQQVRSRWQSLRVQTFSNAAIQGTVDSMAALLQESQSRNFQRWPILGTYIWPNNFIGFTYASEVTYLKNWLTNRLIWLDGAINNLVTGLDEQAGHYSLSAFPNPLQGEQLQLVLEVQQQAELDVRITDLSGRICWTQRLNAQAGHNTFQCSPQLDAGFYLLQVSHEGRLWHTHKLVVEGQ